MAVPASHMFACRAEFVRNVLPHFPEAKGRFERYFCDSYSLIRSLPADGGFPFGLAMTILGVQGLDVPKAPVSHEILSNMGTLREVGLGCRMRNSGQVEVYNRELVSPVLSQLFSRPAGIISVIEDGLQRFEECNRLNPGRYPYSLLVWPSLVKPGPHGFMTLTMTFGERVVECASALPDVVGDAIKGLRAIESALSVVDQVRKGMANCADSFASLFAVDS